MNSEPQPQLESVIAAAGGILLRKTASGHEQVCIVQRKLRNDWTLPKGKLEPHETFQEAAHREVKEETGWDCELGEYLGAIGYEADGSPKTVLFWRMVPTTQGEILNKEEIVKAEWVSVPHALRLLNYSSERDFLARVTGRAGANELSEAIRPGYSWLDRLFFLKRARARLARECEAFGVELESLEERTTSPDKTWVEAARRHLSAAKRYEKAGEIEGGWLCLHAAQRETVFGLHSEELSQRARILRLEAKKISPSWRADAINVSLGQEQITPEQLSLAMTLRDEHFANRYHKVWLTGDQLGILIKICVPALLLLVLLIRFKLQAFLDYSHNAWSWPVVLAVIVFGLFGASFSCSQSLIGETNTRSIPERVADHYVTLTRIFAGAVVGLASYSFYVSKLFTIKGLEDSIGAAFTIAFIFGYSGEKLVARVANKGNGSK